MKFEKAGSNQTLVIDWTSLYTMDRQTGGQRTDRTGAKQYRSTALFFERGHNNLDNCLKAFVMGHVFFFFHFFHANSLPTTDAILYQQGVYLKTKGSAACGLDPWPRQTKIFNTGSSGFPPRCSRLCE